MQSGISQLINDLVNGEVLNDNNGIEGIFRS